LTAGALTCVLSLCFVAVVGSMWLGRTWSKRYSKLRLESDLRVQNLLGQRIF